MDIKMESISQDQIDEYLKMINSNRSNLALSTFAEMLVMKDKVIT